VPSWLPVEAVAGGGGKLDTGAITVGISDGLVESASEVVVSFTGLELKPKAGASFTLEPNQPLTIDLLEYQDGKRAVLLDGEVVGAGEYNWLRLAVQEMDSYIVVNGQQYPLEIPSGEQSGLKLIHPFTVAVGSITDFTIEFDLRKSLVRTGAGRHELRPALRIMDTLATNSISGTVDASLITAEKCNNGDNDDIGNAVYVFPGGAGVQDVQGDDGDPLTTANVTYNNASELYEFTVAFLSHGDYRLAFTCDASLDDPLQNDLAGMAFTAPVEVNVAAEPVPPVVFD